MADFGSPATPNYTAPDGLATLGSLMSLKHKQQGLVQQQLDITGQESSNQSAVAKASIDTRTASEQSKLSQIPWDSFEKADGSYDVDTARKVALKVAPTTGADFAQRLNDTTRGAAETKKAFLGLSQDMQQGVRSALGSWGADPNADLDTLKTQAEAAKANAPDAVRPQLSTVVDHALKILTGPDTITGKPKTLQQAKNAAVGFSRAGLSNAEVSGPGGLATPQDASIQTGARTLTGTTAPALQGGAFTPATAVGNEIGPSITQLPTGQIGRVAPGGGSVAPVASAGPTNVNPTAPEMAVATGQAKGVGERVEQAKAQANNTIQTQDALGRALHILDTGAAANTGVGFDARKGIKNFLAGVGIDTKGADDTNSLVKNLARYEASRATAAGLGGTDAARELSHNGSPNTNIDNAALKGIVRQSLATEKAISAYAAIQSKSANPQALMKNENDFRNIPNLVQGYEYGLTKSPQEANEFLEKHGLSKADMKKTRGMIKDFESR